MPKGNRSIRPGTSRAPNTTSEIGASNTGSLRIAETGFEEQLPTIPGAPKQIWLKLPQEPAELYEAFLYWLRQPPPRNFEAVRREHKSMNWHQRDRWRWDQRANAFDNHMFSKQVVQVEDERRKAMTEIADTGNKMLSVAKKYLALILEQGGTKIGAEGLARLADIGAKLTQLGLGKPTEDVNTTFSTLEQLVREAHSDAPDAKAVTD